MAMANTNLIGVFVSKLWSVQALACGGGDATKNIISPKFSNFGDIIMVSLQFFENVSKLRQWSYYSENFPEIRSWFYFGVFLFMGNTGNIDFSVA